MKKAVYRRPNKPSRMTVIPRRRDSQGLEPLRVPEVVEVSRQSECHVTPLPVAARMVEYLGPVGDFLTVDPQAGTGNLIQALYDSGHSPCETVAIERDASLCATLRKRFTGNHYVDPIHRCFLAYEDEFRGRVEFPRILMNPPFRQVRQHMTAALNLLGRHGHSVATLVALVPITYEHDEAEELERLPRDTFPTVNVSTKIIRICR